MKALTDEELQKAILVVNGNAYEANIVRDIFHALGFRKLRKTRNAIQALEVMRDSAAGVVVMAEDVMPGGGIAFCQTLRLGIDSPGRTTPILMTAHTPRPELVFGARDAGANHVLAMPFSPLDLQARLRAVLRASPSFITAEGYVGPDRRRRNLPVAGIERRQSSGAPADLAQPMAVHLGMGLTLPPKSGERADNGDDDGAEGVRSLPIGQLTPGMELAEDVRTPDGALVAGRGVILSERTLARLRLITESGLQTCRVRV
jgi:CheY-like chemotaxis protein